MRLIDADKIVAYLHEQLEFAKLNNDRCLKVAFKHAILKLDNAPTIDAVPVVLCKDCSWRKKNTFCLKHMHYAKDDYFCADGERTDGEENAAD